MQVETETLEPHNQEFVTHLKQKNLSTFGIMSNMVWHDDPKRIAFVLSRYKFVSKMFSGFSKVLEVGCADAFGTRVVLQETKELVAIDIDPVFIQDVQNRMDQDWKFDCKIHDMLDGPLDGEFEGVYSIDVLEHIPRENEKAFIKNMVDSLAPHGVLIVGSPSIQSQTYASKISKLGHVNCKDHAELKDLLRQYFHNVFIFSMNDEVVHTGFYPMAHYLFALCTNKKSHVA